MPTRLIIYVVIAVLFVGVATGIYYSWKEVIRHETLIEFNEQQAKINAENQQKFIETQKQLLDRQVELIESIRETNEKLKTRLEGVNTFLNSDDAKRNNGAASPVITKTLKMLREGVNQ